MDIGNEKKIVPIEWIPEMNERAKYQNKWVVLKNKKNDGVWCYLEIWPTFDGVYKIESYRESDDYSGYVDYESQTKLLTIEDLKALKTEYPQIDWGKYEPSIREKQESVWDRLVYAPCDIENSTYSVDIVDKNDMNGLVTVWRKLFKDGDGYREYVLYIDKGGILYERIEIRKNYHHMYVNTKRIVPKAEVASLIHKYEFCDFAE